MARHFVLVAVMLASALVSRAAVSQNGASVSLTHTVTVTVPPRVKVQVGSAHAPSAVRVSGQAAPNGLALSINATQPWTLSIGAAGKNQLQWSRDGVSGFSAVSNRDTVIAAGTVSQIPTSASIFVRPAASATRTSDDWSDTGVVVLTIVAQ